MFFVDGPAGSGKTYLYNAIVSYLQAEKKEVLQLATTGIAADLLKDGRTVHSGMKLPVPLSETSTSKLRPNTSEAKRIIEASLILIDEVSMMSKYALKAIDEVLKRLCNCDDLFGGKTIILGGDFRQTANVVLRGSAIDIIEASIQSSLLWSQCKILSLSVNMRAQNQIEFAEWLIKVGDGSLNDCEGMINIPKQYLEQDLVKHIFGTELLSREDELIANKIILTTRNEDANLINECVMNLLEGQSVEYCSADSIISDDTSDYHRYPVEFLNKQQLSGNPTYKLKLKVGMVAMLLRN